MSRGKSRRAAQAEETQRLILEAALRLFTSKGYGATSVGDIAAEAGVAVPTVYTSIGPKPTLLHRLLDWVEQQADIRRLTEELLASQDPSQVLALQVSIARQLSEQCGEILAALASAAQVDREMAGAYQAGIARHREGSRTTANRLAQLGGLVGGVTTEQATAMIATLTLPAIWSSLHHDFGWSFDEAEDWIFATLRDRLLRTGQTS
jgi:AcrR family transcriptional regulator